jgi:hypothetical protein
MNPHLMVEGGCPDLEKIDKMDQKQLENLMIYAQAQMEAGVNPQFAGKLLEKLAVICKPLVFNLKDFQKSLSEDIILQACWRQILGDKLMQCPVFLKGIILFGIHLVENLPPAQREWWELEAARKQRLITEKTVSEVLNTTIPALPNGTINSSRTNEIP